MMETTACDTKSSSAKSKGQDVSTLHLPLGLLGFENIKKFTLMGRPEEKPFLWLQVVDDPNLAFLVVPPFEVVADYQPDVSTEDCRFLGIKNPKEAVLLCIVTIRGQGNATVNLKGPIVFNGHTRIGKQVVLANAADYAIQHPLPVAT